MEGLLLKNFQKWDELGLDLSNPITVIVGPSDRGKSAIIRALKWVCLNQPAGTEFIRKGQAEAAVTLSPDPDNVVIRGRSKTANLYQLNGHPLYAFGQATVPPEVAELLGVSDVNFQDQHDPPFWFTLTAGEVSRNLNQIVNLGSIDAALNYVASEVRKAKAAKDVSEERLSACRDERLEAYWALEFDEDLADLEAAELAARQSSENASILRSLLAAVKSSQADVDRLCKAAREGANVVALGESAVESAEQAEQLRHVLENIRSHEETLSWPVPDDLDAILAVRKEADAVAERRRSLEELVGTLKTAKDSLWQLTQDLKAAEAELKEAESRASVCPQCGQPLTPPSGSPSSTSRTYTSPRNGRSPARTRTGSPSSETTFDR